jgi:DNA-binding MarR family transcriptional regulator
MFEQRTLSPDLYRALADFRYEVRRFAAFSASAASSAGLPIRQHQALLVIKGAPAGEPVTVGLLAARLMVAPHTAGELGKRLERAGYVTVTSDAADRRRRVLRLTSKADAVLDRLSAQHLQEITELAPRLVETLSVLTRLDRETA